MPNFLNNFIMKKGAITSLISAILMSTFTSAAHADFTDVNSNTDYANAILWMQEEGIVEGYADGSFGVDKCVNRAEYLTILYRMMDVELETSAQLDFSDVPEGEWFTPYVATAVSRGSVNGYPDGTFKPANCVNRAEAVKIAVLEFDIAIYNTPASNKFSDIDNNAWYADTMNYADANDLLGTAHVDFAGDKKYYPDGEMSRSEVSELFYRMETGDSSEKSDDFVDSSAPSSAISPTSNLALSERCDINFTNSASKLSSVVPVKNSYYFEFKHDTDKRIENFNDFLSKSAIKAYLFAELSDESELKTALTSILERKWSLAYGVQEFPNGVPKGAYFVIKSSDPNTSADEMSKFLNLVDNPIYDCSPASDLDEIVYFSGSDYYGAFYKDFILFTDTTSDREELLENIKNNASNLQIDQSLNGTRAKW